MSQFHPSQHGGDNDVQMWQQQMMYKQIQEFQRQQQQQQLDHGTKMQNSFGQFQAPAKPTPADYSSTVMNEMPMNEPSCYARSNNISVSDSRLGINSQMFNTGNPQWEQQLGVSLGTGNFQNGSVYSNSQNTIRPMGLFPNKINQSFHSLPASMGKGSGNQYSQFPVFPANSNNAMGRESLDQSDMAARFANSVNSFQNEHVLGQQGMPNNLQNFHDSGSVLSDSSTHSQSGNFKAGSPILGSNLQHGYPVQDFPGRIKQAEIQSALHAGQPSSAASLDPAEEKILYGNDTDFTGLLGGEDSSGGVPNGLSSGNDNSNKLMPSQQGRWSALMQEALQSTSSTNGLQEEWSGVNFQNTDQSLSNSFTFPDVEQRQLTALNNMNLHTASPSAQPSPSHSGALGSMNNPNLTSFRHATKSSYEKQEKFSYESPAAAINTHTTTEADDRYFQQSLNRNYSGQYGLQEQANLSNGIWAQQKPGLPKGDSNSGGAQFMPHNVQALGILQQNTLNYNFNRESNNGQNINNSPNISSTDRSLWKSGVNTDSDHRFQVPMVSQDQHQMMVGRSGENFGINCTVGQKFPDTSESQGNNVEQGSANFSQSYLNATSAEGNIANNGHHLSSAFSARRNAFSGMDNHNLGQPDQKTMGSSAMPNHLSGASGISVGHFSSNSLSNTKFMSQSIRPPNNQEHLFSGNCHVAGNMTSLNEKSQHSMTNDYTETLLRNPNGLVQTSQHMLQQFLHKVDNSTVVSGVPIRTADVTTAQLQHNQPSLQGFGLKLAPPTQRQPASGDLWTSHTCVDSKPSDHSVPEEDQEQLHSTPVPTLPSGHPSRSSPFYSSDVDHTGLSSGYLPQINSSGQQYPVLESKSATVNPLSQQPQQGTSATLFRNVWTNISAQRLAGIQHNKITPNVLQSMMFPNTVDGSNLWSSTRDDYQRSRAENPSDAARITPNSESQEVKQAVDNDVKSTSCEMPNVDQMGDILSGKNESLQRHSLDGTLIQQGSMNPIQGGNMTALHGSPTLSNAQQQNYSLLHQTQTMEPVDIDPSNTSGKRLKTTEMSSYASQTEWMAVQRGPYGENNSVRLCTEDSEASRVPSSFPSDVQMLSFAPRNSEEITPSMPSQLHSRELSSHHMATARTHLQNQFSSLDTSSEENSIERNDRLRVNPQTVPSWFQQHGSYRNGQNLVMYNASKSATQYNIPKGPLSLDSSNVVGHGLDSSNSVGPAHSMSSKLMELPEMPPTPKASSMVVRPKKRKFKAPELVSWNQIIEGNKNLTNTRTVRMDWARETNRLMEKVEDEANILEAAPISYLPRRRLIMTSRMIQQLLPAIPAAILRAQALSVYQSVTYTVSKLTIGDACSLASLLYGDNGTLINNGNKSSEQTRNINKMEDRFLKAVELFVGRLRKMENDFVSLNKSSSMLDVQLECQDLERISIVNRLGKFHGRNHHAPAVEASSTSDIASCRIYPDRQVISCAVPGNLPEGVSCLSL